MVEKACRIARQLRDIGIRRSGVVRIDSATGVHDWADNPAANQKLIAKTFSEACDVAEQHGERLAAEGEICWGGMHSWKHMVRAAGDGRPAQDARLPGRHGAYAALHAGLQRARASPSARRITIGRTDERSTSAQGGHRTRCGRGRSIFTSRRTTRPSKAQARTTRPDGTAWPTIRTASSISSHDAGYWLRDDKGELTKSLQAHLLGRLHVPERRDDEAEDVERHSRRDGCGARSPRLASSRRLTRLKGIEVMHGQRKKLNVGMVGYGFMGRTHSNAFGKVNQFFDLDYEPGAQGRVRTGQGDKVEGFAEKWGYESRPRPTGASSIAPQAILISSTSQPQRHARRDRACRRCGRQDGDVRKAARP